MRAVVLLVFLVFNFSFGKTMTYIVSFPSSPKKITLMQEVASELGISVLPVYVRGVENLKGVNIRHSDFCIADIPSEQIRKAMENILISNRCYVLNAPETGPDTELARTLYRYYDSGRKHNFKNMLYVLLGMEAQPPDIIPQVGFYLKDGKILQQLEPEVKRNTDILLLIHRGDLVSENTRVIDRIMEVAGENGLRVAGFFYPEQDGLHKHIQSLYLDGKPFPKVVINTRMLYFNYEEERKAFEELGVPVLGTITYRGKLKEWESSNQGIQVVSIPVVYTVSEYAGVIDQTVIAWDDGEKLPVDYMLDNFVRRVKRWISLAEKKNNEKKVAFVYYNYPPGENNILASNLNVIRSFENILRNAKERGYDVEELDENTIQQKLTAMIKLYYGKKVDPRLLHCVSIQEYREWYDNLPENIRKDVENYWSTPEKDQNLKDGCFYVPVFWSGKFAFLPLAPRGIDYIKSKEIYHSTRIPPSHYYLSFYLYLQKNFDAVVHFGTHGTQEWTPGKERALSIWDYPYVTLGEVPVIYPYIVDNVGEAVNAKRRGRAVIVSHQTPAFAPSGTYGALEDIHQLLHKETQAEGKLKENIRKSIAVSSIKTNLAKDIGYNSVKQILKDFENFSEKLHNYIHQVASQNIPLGLHTFGKTKEDKLLYLTILQMMGKQWVSKFGEDDYEEFMSQPVEAIVNSKPYRKVVDCIKVSSDPDCDKVVDYYRRFDADVELVSFFNALEGKYIPTSYGGDPVRNPDSIPTGKNLYSFDPSRIPTKQAWATAVEITDRWLKQYLSKNGRYPSKVGFTMWSVETMRHFGVVEGQILYLLGVRPKWDEGGKVVDLEIIPRQELNRPRIDVVISATGLYRDHFPNLLNLINRAVRLVSGLEEEGNFVRQNTEKIKQRLHLSADMDKAQVEKVATIRTFSNESGAYGSGLDEAVFQTKDEKTLAEIFIGRMGFAYDETIHSKRILNLFEENLKDTDSVILSRSSNLYGMLTTDDPFQYLGGLALAVKSVSGREPEILISNLRGNGYIQTAQDFLVQEVRGRYLNPEYVKSLIKEGYSGVNQLLDTLNNLYGWQVVSKSVVKDYLWKEFEEVYLKDKYRLGTAKWLEQNPQAKLQIIKRIQEGYRKVSLPERLDSQLKTGKVRTDGFSQSSASKLKVSGFVMKKIDENDPVYKNHRDTLLRYLIPLLVVFTLYFIGFTRGYIFRTES